MNFIDLANIIFLNKYKYKSVSDKDKTDNFYLLNKKFSLKYLKISQFFNHKFIDKACALDLWFIKFKPETKIPGWYWASSSKNKTEKKVNKIPEKDRQILLEHSDVEEKDLDFLIENYIDDVNAELKKLKKFSNIK